MYSSKKNNRLSSKAWESSRKNSVWMYKHKVDAEAKRIKSNVKAIICVAINNENIQGEEVF